MKKQYFPREPHWVIMSKDKNKIHHGVFLSREEAEKELNVIHRRTSIIGDWIIEERK